MPRLKGRTFEFKGLLMSDKVKNETGAPITPASGTSGEKASAVPSSAESDYEKLLEKSLEEQISDTQISRADITNPNLHYGVKEEAESIAPASELPTQDQTTPLEQKPLEQEAEETQPQEESPEQEILVSDASTYIGGTVPELQTPETQTPTTDPDQPGAPPPPDPEDPSIDPVIPPVDPVDPGPGPGGGGGPETFNPDLVSDADTIDENAAAGTLVATLDLEDAGGTSYTYAITDENGNPVTDPNFVISGDQILVAPGANIDFESNPTLTFYVTGTDGLGNTVTEQISVTVNDVDEFDVSAISDTDGAANSVA